MSKAEEQALKAYPRATRDIGGMVVDIGHPQYMRDLYIEGYNQAEQDLMEKAKQWFTDNLPSEKVQLLWCDFEQFITEN